MANPKKSALGRGLSALLENEETDITSSGSAAALGSTSEIAISSIEANPFSAPNSFREQCPRRTGRKYQNPWGDTTCYRA